MIKAQITVYASLTFAIVISFICTMINSVRMSVIYYETDMASRMSAESVFGGYHNECLSEFNIFVISNEQCNDNKLEYYARKNIENICQKNSVVFNKACITDLKYMTDNNGNAVKEQILNYMKYASAGEIISAFSSDGETETERGECIKDINKSIQECDIDNSFIGKQNIISAYISEINYKYQNISVCITDLKEDLLLLEEYKDEKYLEVYKYNYAILRKETDDVQQISDKIIEQIDSYNDENQDFQKKINACLEKIKSKKDILGEEVSTVMGEDLKKSTSDEDKANRLNTVRQDLLTNLRDINLINELVLKPEEIDLYSNTWEYKEKFEKLGIEYFYTLIDDAVARVIRSEGGFIWACKNYDGDVMSDMVATAYGDLSMMTSVLVSPSGVYEYEAAHGTVQRHYYKHLKGEETSTNSIATIFAWTGALRKRGELDEIPELMDFADKLERACIKTVEDGKMTKSLSLISTCENPVILNSLEFIQAIRETLDSLM